MRPNSRKILITGGAGFIGYHLAFALSQDRANEIVLADNMARGRLDDDLEALAARPGVRLMTGDLTDPAFFSEIGQGFDEVYHLAAVLGVNNVISRPHDVIRVNALSTIHLLDWFVKGGGQRLLFSSTSEAYAWTNKVLDLPIPTPEDVPLSLVDLNDPRSSYAGSKIFGELAVRQYCAQHGKRFAILRFHNVYGPRMGMDHVIPQLYARIMEGQDPLVVYSAGHRRAFCFVSDAVAGTIAAMRGENSAGVTFNIGNDLEELTIADLARQILDKAGVRAALDPQKAENDPIERRCANISRAREILSYEPKVPLDKGLEMTISWYKSRLRVKAA